MRVRIGTGVLGCSDSTVVRHGHNVVLRSFLNALLGQKDPLRIVDMKRSRHEKL